MIAQGIEHGLGRPNRGRPSRPGAAAFAPVRVSDSLALLSLHMQSHEI